MKSQEFTTGIDHELNATMAVSVHYVHKQLDRAVEDTGFLTPAGDEGYVIANPSEGLTSLAFTNPNIPMPKPKRQYDSVEFALDKRFANNWSLRAAYLWSRLYGNYSGLSQSDENGRADPNVGRSYDYPAMMFTGNGDPSYGPLATDRPNQFKAQAIYQFNFGTSDWRQRIRVERSACDARAGHPADQQLPEPVPRSWQRRSDGHVLRRRTSSSSTGSRWVVVVAWR